MKKTFAISLLALAAGVVHAAAPDSVDGWSRVASSTNQGLVYFIKNKSVDLSKNAGGDTIVYAVGMQINRESQREVYQFYVKVSACTDEYGMLYRTTTEGKYIGESPFAFNQGSVGAAIAETLCAVLDNARKTPTNGKSKSSV
jgi:hypothetical protein